ncbi:hypothetical protein HQ39_09505 [Porphyromonas sp. COT-108 OH2963]|uniref:radical SAM protein n=1 Tax=Porphyromonas sp. COT-108 OH2963 TaxID=1515614 RepID=UPI00052D5FC9|nr:radical SAM protein [Porphyromonas sp. COT-108 OH2963]KGN93832.1 hypothetical protein HQ39_09505 [Porphyromonas sp. COT-108 OH2963]
MVEITNKLKKIDMPSSIFGGWSKIICFNQEGDIIGMTDAHDGDFFPLSILDYVDALKKIRNGSYRVPLQVDIDITQNCNCNCHFCFSSSYRKNPNYYRSYINKVMLDNLLQELASKGTKSVRYCGGGEPLMHPDIKEIIKLPSKYNLKSTIITNGDFLTSEIAELMLEYVNKIQWSLNSITDETRMHIHRSNTGIDQTLKVCKSMIKSRTQFPIICSTFLLHPDNVNEILETIKKMSEIGIDSLSFRNINHKKISWKIEDLKKLNNTIKIAKDLNLPFVHFPSFKDKSNIPLKCLSTQLRTVIESYKEGYLIQYCGLFRGSGIKNENFIKEFDSFESRWEKALKEKNLKCSFCIDSSINRALNFINKMLNIDENAIFETNKTDIQKVYIHESLSDY